MSSRFPLISEKPVFVIASSNGGKLLELQDLLGDFAHVVTLADLPGLKEGDEVGATFQQNAHIKSLAISKQLPSKGNFVLADDSGLQVDALGGRPGVLSARYGGMGDTRTAVWDSHAPKVELGTKERDDRNNLRLMADMKDVPVPQRGAQFHTVLSLARDGKILITVEAVCRGALAMAPRGEHGFAYDPFFEPAGQKGKKQTFGEMAMAEKHRYSVRARALDQLLKTMKRYNLLPEGTELHRSPDFAKSRLKTAVWVSESLRGRDEEGRLPVVKSPDRFSGVQFPTFRLGEASLPGSGRSQPILGR